MRSILTALQEGRLFELPEAGKSRALEFLARILDANPDIEVGTDALEEVQKRELECNTGIGMGVGVPHIRARREEGELFCAIGWSAKGIDYGAADAKPVHLVVMYYIPGAQKNVYLKEISTLVKAIKKSGGVDPVARATELNDVRNLLLDWVSSGLGDAGPDAVARMIRLDVRQSAGAPAPTQPIPADTTAQPRPGTRAATFQILVAGNTAYALCADGDFAHALEKDTTLSQRLSAGTPFALNGRQIFVSGSTPYAAGRVLYQCVALTIPA